MNDGKNGATVPHPRASTNPISAVTFWWTGKIFRAGLKRDIEVDDLYEPLKEHKSSLLGDKFERIWNEETRKLEKQGKHPTFLRILLKVYGLQFLMYGLLRACVDFCVRVVQPLFLGFLLQYFTPGTTISESEAYLYATGVIVSSLVTCMVVHPYMMAMCHLGLKMRVASCSLLYRKALRLSKSTLGETTVGQIVNLMANDVHRFDHMVIFGHYLWLGPLETAVVTYLIWIRIGVSAFGGIIAMLLFIPLHGYLGKLTSKLRFKTAVRTDDRVRIMNEIIAGIQVIKMYAWEKPFSLLVAAARRKEMNAVRSMQYIRSITLSMNIFVTRVSVFVCVLTYVLLGENVTAEKVFVVTAYFNVIKHSMSEAFPKAIGFVAEGLVSIKRIEKFLIYGEVEKTKITQIHHQNLALNGSEKEMKEKLIPCLSLNDVTAKWHDDLTENTLNQVSLTAVPGKLLAVIGPVGAGKTSLLNTILGELPLTSGSMVVRGRVSYASQEPWLFAASLRQNILFGEPYDRERYRKVIKYCALEEDFAMFPHSDKTLVGDRGVMLSGGQKARVNLARAVYRKADIYLLDDPLSAVDPHVARHLFELCITGFLSNKICILITHQLQFLHHIDEIAILKDGKIEAKGTYTQLQQSGLDFAKLLASGEESEIAVRDVKPPDEGDTRKSLDRTSSLEDVPAPQQEEEMRSSGGVSAAVYYSYFAAGGSFCMRFLVAVFFILTTIISMGSDYWLSYWTNVEELKQPFTDMDVNSTGVFNKTDTDITPYGWMPSTEICVYIYSALIISTIIVTLIRSVSFFILCTRASSRLHNLMFTGVTRATMHFFNNNPSGRILNRFSRDIGTVDEILPMTIIDCFQIMLILVGTIVTVIVVNYWMIVPTVILAAVFWGVRYVFLETSRSVKRLESITRSPVFSHTSASLQGITTIRAFGAQNMLEKEFDIHQDLNSTAFYIFVATSRAFGLWLDIVCVAYLAVVTYSFLFIGQGILGGSVGLAITQSLSLTGMFQWGIRQSAELINQMTSTERVLELAAVSPEPPLETPSGKKPNSDWPQKGKIVFQQVYLKYNKNEPPVLKNLNFTIMPQEKIGIVGRTGAGKSSLIAALFRLTTVEGAIFIDGINTQTLGLHDFRSKISIIPQEPVLFSGTLRKNLDPFDEFPDETLWQALEEVELKDIINETPGGLSWRISEGGSNFSVGQRQLVCLARALIRKNRILVMDEATANVDPGTDALIQQTVRRKFSACTVLTIAHRLHTIMDSDKVLVMDSGSLVEFDHPHLLLANKRGIFYSMVEQTGKSTSEELHIVAEESFKNKLHKKSS